MSKMVAQSASRALGLLISKDKAFGGMPYTCYTKCFDATVQSIIDYSAALWGTKSYKNCITWGTIHYKIKFYVHGVFGDRFSPWQWATSCK